MGAADKMVLEAGSEIAAVEKFCYLTDMFSVDGIVTLAVTNTIRCGCSKFRQLAPKLTAKDTPLITRRKVRSSAVRSSMLHCGDTWPAVKELEKPLERIEMTMVQWICGKKLRNRVLSEELRIRLGI